MPLTALPFVLPMSLISMLRREELYVKRRAVRRMPSSILMIGDREHMPVPIGMTHLSDEDGSVSLTPDPDESSVRLRR
jgi:hypothetical protein